MAPRSERLEQAFEELVELVLSGALTDPAEFLARHPELDDSERARLAVRARVLLGGSEEEPLPLERLGDFRLLRKIGSGSMGVVYLARQESLGRLMALKVMAPGLVHDEASVRRFEREARAVARLRHPNIVTVLATGEEQGVRYLALEYIDGRSLEQVLRSEGPELAPGRVVRWGIELAEALAYAHEAGVVHRDVKPSNVRIDSRDRALLVDFGLARLDDASTLSGSAQFVGTPIYASPEQIEAGPLDGRSDVYSLGATLYQCLSGRAPFEAGTREQVFHAILALEPTRPRTLVPGLSRELETILLTCLEKEPGRRYASAGALAEDLRALQELRPIRARPPGALTRVVKWSRRNRGTSAASAVALALALVSTGVFARQRWRAQLRFSDELARAELARTSGDFDTAAGALERALALRPADGATLARREALRREAAAVRAQAAIERAELALAGYRAESTRHVLLAAEVVPLRQALTTRPMDALESAHLLAMEDELATLARALEARFAEAIETLNLARGLDPDNAASEQLLAELYLERWRAATAALDTRGARDFRALVERHDRAGRHASELGATVALTLTCTPPGAEVFLFRYEEQGVLVEGGEPRLVPVPVPFAAAPSGTPAPGTWALRVLDGAGQLEPEDLVLSVAGQPIEGTLLVAEDGAEVRRYDRLLAVDGRPVRDEYDARWLGEEGQRERAYEFARGSERFVLRARKLSQVAPVRGPRALVERGGVPLEVWCRGVRRALEAPEGLEVRVTAAPLFRSPACLAGTAPLVRDDLTPGSYLALVCAAGCESQRVPLVLKRGEPCELVVALHPLGTSPRGFVYVPPGRRPIGGDPEAFTALAAAEVDLPGYWIQEHEVGVREYAQFVNDFATLEQIEAAPELVRVPRDSTAGNVAAWRHLEDGSFAPPVHTLEQPVHGISWHDAEAYARWLTEQGTGFEYALPSEVEWERAARGADLRGYPFGNRFVPRWVKGFFAREQALLEPQLSFPIDESPAGAFDMTGSLWEWVSDDWDALGAKRLRGGAWNFTFPAFFRAASCAGQEPTAADGIYGLRLVARRLEGR